MPEMFRRVFLILASLLFFMTPTIVFTQEEGMTPYVTFGGFFVIYFTSNTLDQLNDCLCNSTIIQCNLHYKLLGDQEIFEIPYYYDVVNVDYTVVSQNVAANYKSLYICDVIEFSPENYMNCQRQLTADNRCESDDYCTMYYVLYTDSQCDVDCTRLVWHAEYTMPINYYNFEGFPLIIEGATCPNENFTQGTNNTYAATTVTTSINLTTPNPSSVSDSVPLIPDTEATLESERSQNLLPIMYIIAGSGGTLFIAGTVSFFLCKRWRRGKKVKRADTPSSTETESSTHKDRMFVELDECDEDQYQKIKDFAIYTGIGMNIPDIDHEGYNMILDCGKPIHSDEKPARPLPNLPDSQANSLSLPSTQSEETSFISLSSATTSRTGPQQTATSTETQDVTHSSSTKARSPAIAFSGECVPTEPQQKDCSNADTPGKTAPAPHRLKVVQNHKDSTTIVSKPNTNLHTTQATGSDLNLSSRASVLPPAPHKFPVSPEQNQHLGLVNLRRDHPWHTQVRLVRTPCGHIDLVTVEEELPAFAGYYSRIQLVGLQDGTVGVVGQMDTSPDVDDDHKYFDLLDVHHHCAPSTPDNEFTDPPRCGDESSEELCFTKANKSGSLPLLQFIYFGSLTLDGGHRVKPTQNGDYLTVLDVDPSAVPTKSGDYLTVLDVDPGASHSKNNDYLTLLNVDTSATPPPR